MRRFHWPSDCAVSCLTECAANVKVQPRRSRRHRDGLHAATFMTILPLFTPSRAVGVVAPPCPGGQAACRGRQHSSLFRIADIVTELISLVFWHQITNAFLPSRAAGVDAPLRSRLLSAHSISKREYHEVAFTLVHRRASPVIRSSLSRRSVLNEKSAFATGNYVAAPRTVEVAGRLSGRRSFVHAGASLSRREQKMARCFLQYARTCMPGCQRCRMRLNAPLQGSWTILSDTRKAL